MSSYRSPRRRRDPSQTPAAESRQRWENTYWSHLLKWCRPAIKQRVCLWLLRACQAKIRAYTSLRPRVLLLMAPIIYFKAVLQQHKYPSFLHMWSKNSSEVEAWWCNWVLYKFILKHFQAPIFLNILSQCPFNTCLWLFVIFCRTPAACWLIMLIQYKQNCVPVPLFGCGGQNVC